MNATKDPLAGLRERCREGVLSVQERSAKRAYVELVPEALPEAARYMFRDLGARLMTCTAFDARSHMEILYHFALDYAGCVVNLRVRIPRDKPEIESIAKELPAAEFIEREMWELFGIEFRNHPNLRRLLLAEDWPERHWPLRHDDHHHHDEGEADA